MKKKFVMAVAAVALAAAVGISTFAATGLTVSSITGDDAAGTNVTTISSGNASETTVETYTKITTALSNGASLETAVAEVVGETNVATVAAEAQVESFNELKVYDPMDVTTAGNTATLSVSSVPTGETVYAMYYDPATGAWVYVSGQVVDGKVAFNVGKAGTYSIVLITKDYSAATAA